MNEKKIRLCTIPLLLFVFMTSACVPENPSGASGIPPSGEPPVSLLDSNGTARLSGMLHSYYGLKNALAEDNASAADTYARLLIADISTFPLPAGDDTSLFAVLRELLDHTDSAARAIVAAKDETCEYQRIAFKQVSDHLLLLIQAAGLKHLIIYRQYCPMAFNDRGAYWLSEHPEIKNPYFGKKMQECGELSDTLY